MRRTVVLLALVYATMPGLAAADSVSEALAAGLSAAATVSHPGACRREDRAETRRQGHRGAAVFLGRHHTLYVEMRDGTRALIRPSKILVRTKDGVVRAKPGTPLGNTDLLLEDLLPIVPGLLKVPQMSDQGPTGTVLTGAPGFPSTRALIVLTIDPDDHVLTRGKYFESRSATSPPSGATRSSHASTTARAPRASRSIARATARRRGSTSRGGRHPKRHERPSRRADCAVLHRSSGSGRRGPP
jgi:hypothetical protein